jgi:two-component system CheB/CheR fusion protein
MVPAKSADTMNLTEATPDGGTGRRHPPMVAIGASAGSARALQDFFSAMPEDTGAVFVVAGQPDPGPCSVLSNIISGRTRMPVVQVGEREKLEADHVYVIPPDRRLRIADHEISALEFDEPRGQRAPIDLFFRSAAERLGDGFAVILSGAGSDGAVGVRTVKESGGIILVQDPSEAEHPSMPRGAIDTGAVDFVFPVRNLVDRLVDLIRVRKNGSPDETVREIDEDVLRRILAHLRVRTGHDFTRYKRSMVLRRIARRMQVTRVDDFQSYYRVLRERDDEAQSLLGDLLISVTTFFRDVESFNALQRLVIPELFTHDAPIRVWIAGCATGEEAYSVAMLLLEEASRHERRPPIQVFGSDLDAGALSIAREGRFPAAIEADVSEERLRRFFTREGDAYRVRQELRDIMLFAVHDLLKDPPFSHVDLISCRNVLIYLDRELQEQVCGTFHYALNPGGHLLLGGSESAEGPSGLFRPLDRNARIYRSTARHGDKPRPLPNLPGPVRVREPVTLVTRGVSAAAALSEAAVHRRALEKTAPPSVLVDDMHRVVHLSDNAGRFLQPSGGPLSADVVELVRPELRVELRSALNRLFERRRATLSLPILVRFNGTPHRVHLHVRSADESDAARPRSALVSFIEGEAIPDDLVTSDQEVGNETVRRLTQELELTQTRLRTVSEESEAANEELRAANEELQSINEEYRSTCEELETSKEELQSINEELQTVNSELKLKLETLSRADSDLQNLLAVAEFGALFLDSNLRIKRFTDRVTELFGVTPADEGRPIADFAQRLEYESLAADACAVLGNLAPVQREIHSRDGRWYDVSVRPYRTVDDKIDGVVITFVDMTERRAMQEQHQLLLGELTHRVKNTLAVVQSIARQTLRNTPSLDQFIERFEGRLAALAEAHGLLVQSQWRGADLAALARGQLRPHAAEGSDRLRIEGPSVVLDAELATPFGLVLHELASNAVKYGALSRRTGSVSVTWTLSSRDQAPYLTVVWQESGGPQVREPTKSGLGTNFIEHGIPGATVRREFRPDGFVCTIGLPLPKGNEREDCPAGSHATPARSRS